MKFNSELKTGRLLKRYKRFFADIEYKGEVITAHTPNTGSLKTVPLSDTECWFSTSDDPKRKLKYTLEFIKTPTGWAGTNTRTPNVIVGEALEEGLKGNFKNIQAELKISEKTRIDFVLWNWSGDASAKPTKLKYPNYLEDPNLELKFVEVKNVTMQKDSTALFPDGVTSRGTKHLNELIDLKLKGFESQIIFCVQREKSKAFNVAGDIDPLYAKTLKDAASKGVQISAYAAEMNKKKVSLNWTDPLKIEI